LWLAVELQRIPYMMTIRRIFNVAAVLAFCGVVVSAADQATFVLNNGARQSGTIVYGRGANNIVDGRFHLNSSGNDLTFGIDDVAVIDFAGGTPTAGEQQALPTDATGLMVMRNGSVQRGHLHNLVGGSGGDFVQWVNEAGQRNNYPIQDVARLYLNPQTARSAFLNTTPQPPAAAAPAPAAPVPARATIRVNANQQWTDTGIVVRRGEAVQFNVTGQITIAPGVSVGSNGETQLFSRVGFAAPLSAGAGALIGNVGGSLFVIGSNTQPIQMPADGRLSLGVNETRLDDNTGFFSVVITPQTGATGASDSRSPRGRGNGSGR
jgi:hypothetical protein